MLTRERVAELRERVRLQTRRFVEFGGPETSYQIAILPSELDYLLDCHETIETVNDCTRDAKPEPPGAGRCESCPLKVGTCPECNGTGKAKP